MRAVERREREAFSNKSLTLFSAAAAAAAVAAAAVYYYYYIWYSSEIVHRAGQGRAVMVTHGNLVE